MGSWWELEVQPQGFVRTGLGLNAALTCLVMWKQEETDGVAGALHGIVLPVQVPTQGRMLSVSQQHPQRGGAEPRVLGLEQAQGA